MQATAPLTMTTRGYIDHHDCHGARRAHMRTECRPWGDVPRYQAAAARIEVAVAGKPGSGFREGWRRAVIFRRGAWRDFERGGRE